MVMSQRRTCNCSDCRQESEEAYGLAEIKLVGIEFDPNKINSQEQELNVHLAQNYKVMEHIPTATGLVFILGKFGKTNSDEQNQVRNLSSETTEEFSFGR